MIKKEKPRAAALILLILALCLWFCLPAFAENSAETEESSEDSKVLVVTVVEDIPAQDIEDNLVPLAASDPGAGGKLFRYLAPVLLAAALVGYVIYFNLKGLRLRKRYYQALAEEQMPRTEGMKEKEREEEKR